MENPAPPPTNLVSENRHHRTLPPFRAKRELGTLSKINKVTHYDFDTLKRAAIFKRIFSS